MYCSVASYLLPLIFTTFLETASSSTLPTWLSADIAKVVCDQKKDYEMTKIMPKAITAKDTRGTCGWFKKVKQPVDPCSHAHIDFWSCDEPVIQTSSLLHTRIVGGHDATPYKYSSILLMKIWGNHACSAEILSPEWVMTAAHCIVTKDPNAFQFVAGEYDKSRFEGPEQEVKATRVIVHEHYDKQVFLNDIAVLKVSPPLKFNDKIGPSNLPDPDFFQVGVGMVAGWGLKKQDSGRTATILQEVQIPVITTEKCRQNYGESSIAETMLCAGYDEGKKDACQGDSGGPFFQCVNGRMIQVGIVSWGVGCAKPGQPGVYTKVSKYLDWIKRNTVD